MNFGFSRGFKQQQFNSCHFFQVNRRFITKETRIRLPDIFLERKLPNITNNSTKDTIDIANKNSLNENQHDVKKVI